jgi:hypothetical protein
VVWDVRLQVAASNQLEAAAFRQRIQSHRAALKVQTPAPGYRVASAALLIETATHNQATEVANGILEQALEAFAETLPTSRARSFCAGVEVYPHRPGRSVKGPRNHLLSTTARPRTALTRPRNGTSTCLP